jgi:hypothetical protein
VSLVELERIEREQSSVIHVLIKKDAVYVPCLLSFMNNADY